MSSGIQNEKNNLINCNLLKRVSKKRLFSFVLFGCTSGSGENVMTIYDDHCPNSQSVFYSVEWKTFESFEMYAFRIQNCTSITFRCEVHIFTPQVSMPTACNGQRKRRKVAENHVKKAQGLNLQFSRDIFLVVISFFINFDFWTIFTKPYNLC